MVAIFDGKRVGHCYVNKVSFGKDAFLHLHIWQTGTQKKGMGSEMVKLSIPYFFEKLKLKTLFVNLQR